jgi:cysteine-rich repeat protein
MRNLFTTPLLLIQGWLFAGGCGWFESAPVSPFDGSGGDDVEETDRAAPDAEADLDALESETEGPPLCGNGVVEAGEECDDGNLIHGDGCENDCTYSCHLDSDCDDGNECNGRELCDRVSYHVCRWGTPMNRGDVCLGDPRSVCLEGECGGALCCVRSECGDGYVDTGADEMCEPPGVGGCTGACVWSCEDQGDCPDDGNECNGTAECNLDTHVCENRDPLPDGTVCGTLDPRRICIARNCQESRCGDGFADVSAAVPEECDDGNTISRDGCENDCTYTCTGSAGCDDGFPCTDDVCDPETHACSNPLSDRTKVCRPAAGVCDAAESCTGIGPDCPLDIFMPAAVECRPSAGACDVAENCTGTSAPCPVDSFQPAGTACDDGAYCTDPDRCNGAGVCAGVEVDELYGVSAIAGGHSHACALLTGGRVKCWGNNESGQLGDGTTTGRAAPVDVSGLAAGAAVVAAGAYHTCSLLAGGGVRCWGSNEAGQLGDGTTVGKVTPVNVSGLASGAAAVAAGYSHTCALLAGGGVKCWGNNGAGQLGDGTTENRTVPVDVSGLTSGVAAIAAGAYHTCALRSGGGVKCWGINDHGQLGDGTTTARTAPVDVSGLSSGVTAIAARGLHTCALLSGGGVKCWGYNLNGQLGDGTTADRTLPVDVSGLSSGVSSIVSGYSHTCALLGGGAVKCWGYNGWGQLGDGTTVDMTTPANVSGISSGAAAVAAGYFHTCAILGGGGARCWGDNFYGQLGDGTTGTRTLPVDVAGLSSGVALVGAGGYHACAWSSGRGLQCWGYNSHGQLGDGTTVEKTAPVAVSGLPSSTTALAAGYFHTCALLGSGGVKCWGYNDYGQLGDGTTAGRTAPVDVSGLTSGVAAVAGGGYHTCALIGGGGVRCWGYNYYGQIGDGTTSDRTAPVDVSGLTAGVAAAAAGEDHTCALLAGGGVKCWGRNEWGQLGNGSTTGSATPVDVSGLSSGAAAIAAGYYHTCALLGGGGVKCWGRNLYGQLGDGTTGDRTTPVDVSGLSSGAAAIAAGADYTCALLGSGAVRCWGGNWYGQLGDGTLYDRATPLDVSGLSSGVAAIAAGGYHACALLIAGGVTCWGLDQYGQVSGFFPGYPHPVVCM